MTGPPRHLDAVHWERREWIYPTVGPIVDAVARLLFAIDVDGIHHVPPRGPALVAANHVSHLDPMVLLSVLRRVGRRPRFIALEDLWSVPVVGWLLEHGRMIPVRRGMGAGPMVGSACAALEAGEVVVVYPEGTLTRPDEQRPPRAGAGLLALRARCPVIPVAMAGVPPYLGRLPRLRHPVDVRVGPPVDLTGLDDVSAREARRMAGQTVLDAVRQLV